MLKFTRCSMLVLLLLIAGIASAKDPYMQSGKTQLQKAQAHLMVAGKDKTGYRDRALALVYWAISEVDLGMNSDHHASPKSEMTNVSTAPGLSEMQKTLGYLKQAKENLEAAQEDAGGHRNKAIEYTSRAMAEVEKALAAPAG